jgi:hypothetical protein
VFWLSHTILGLNFTVRVICSSPTLKNVNNMNLIVVWSLVNFSRSPFWTFERNKSNNWKGSSLSTVCSKIWLIWLVYSCFSHLEHRASVKRFVSPQFLNVGHLVALRGRVISPSQGRYLTQSQNKHRHPCLEWDSNPRYQHSSERKQFMPYLYRAATVIKYDIFALKEIKFCLESVFFFSCKFNDVPRNVLPPSSVLRGSK